MDSLNQRESIEKYEMPALEDDVLQSDTKHNQDQKFDTDVVPDADMSAQNTDYTKTEDDQENNADDDNLSDLEEKIENRKEGVDL